MSWLDFALMVGLSALLLASTRYGAEQRRKAETWKGIADGWERHSNILAEQSRESLIPFFPGEGCPRARARYPNSRPSAL